MSSLELLSSRLVKVSLFIIIFSLSLSAKANPNEDLFYAARGGFYDAVVRLIANGANVNYANRVHERPMHAVAATGHLRIAFYLKAKGAEHLVQTQNGWLPLHHAVRFGHIRMASYLLHLGTPLYARTGSGKSVFDLAKMTNNKAMVNFLESYRRNRR